MDVVRLNLTAVPPAAWLLLAVFLVIALAAWLPNPDDLSGKPRAKPRPRVTAGDIAGRAPAAKKPRAIKRVKR